MNAETVILLFVTLLAAIHKCVHDSRKKFFQSLTTHVDEFKFATSQRRFTQVWLSRNDKSAFMLPHLPHPNLINPN